MKHFAVVASILLLVVFSLIGEELQSIDSILFSAQSAEAYKATTAGEERTNFSIAFSPFLPTGGVYSVYDPVTGKEAIVQIGYTEVNHNPYSLYLPEYLFRYFASVYSSPVSEVKVKVKFLAWNRKGESPSALDIESLIIAPDRAISRIEENGTNKHYIQLGSFNYHQNAYPIITKLLPMLEMRPQFYLIKTEIATPTGVKTYYRVLAGPYDYKDATSIVNSINADGKNSVFIKSRDTIINEYLKGGEK